MRYVILRKKSNGMRNVYDKINDDLRGIVQGHMRILSVAAPGGRARRVRQLWSAFCLCIRLLYAVGRDDVVISFYPFEKAYLAVILLVQRMKKYRTAVVVLDANFLRYDADHYEEGCRELACYDELLVQTQAFIARMKDDIHRRMISMDVLPFCTQLPLSEHTSWDTQQLRLCFIGNLNKAGYLTTLHPERYTIDLRGKADARIQSAIAEAAHMRYLGDGQDDTAWAMELAPYHFGLVWDGDSSDIDEDQTGNGVYLRYVAPYKLSMYLAYGLPVIVWQESAMAEFVTRHMCGVCIHGLQDLEQLWLQLSAERYEELRMGAVKMSTRIREGKDFLQAAEKLSPDSWVDASSHNYTRANK